MNQLNIFDVIKDLINFFNEMYIAITDNWELIIGIGAGVLVGFIIFKVFKDLIAG